MRDFANIGTIVQERFAGYQNGLTRAGLPFDEELVVNMGSSFTIAGYDGIREAEYSDPP